MEREKDAEAGSDGRGLSITKAQLSVRDSTGLSVHTPLSVGCSQSSLSLLEFSVRLALKGWIRLPNHKSSKYTFPRLRCV